ncbi:hypothetical protein JG688_00014320 [Phytophthora aleatoria]|uniref:Uncharacterized protein n=1 Tax=Phytophthora aleatoria TaxID=2496075 RepID=A0A8J5J0N9_9STRA|nr:hypothetical protein JG688_00014320 [Phytophthora aleatoria]
MEPTDELFTFGHTKKSIGENGVRALQGVDSARFGVLEEANALVPADKKLEFFIARLSYKYYQRLVNDGWSRIGRQQALHWYSMAEKTTSDTGRTNRFPRS